MSTTRADSRPAPTITVDPGVFAETQAGFSAEEVRVTGVEDPEAAATALERAPGSV